MNDKLLSVAIINWNGAKFLNACIRSIFDQDYRNVEIIVVDNDSKDDSVQVVESFGERVRLIRNANTGYSGGANVGIDASRGDYIVIANPDVVFGKDYFVKCVAALEEDEQVAAVAGKLLKFDFEAGRPRLAEDGGKQYHVIDSAGLRFTHFRRTLDIGQNELDRGQYDVSRRVFGVIAAAAVFRRSALERVKIGKDCFDTDFFTYCEDMDLCWRLNLYGYTCRYLHDTVTYHARSWNIPKGLVTRVLSWTRQSAFLKGSGIRNTFYMMTKNEPDRIARRDAVRITILKTVLFLSFAIFDRKCLPFWRQIKENRAKMLEKHAVIAKNTVLSDGEAYALLDL